MSMAMTMRSANSLERRRSSEPTLAPSTFTQSRISKVHAAPTDRQPKILIRENNLFLDKIRRAILLIFQQTALIIQWNGNFVDWSFLQ